MKLYSKSFVAILLFSFFTVSCDNNQFLHSEYDFPIDSIQGTTVFRWNNLYGDSLFTNYMYRTLDFNLEDTLLTTYSYDNNNLTDSSIYLVRNNKRKLLEHWVFFEDDYGEIITMKSKKIRAKDNYKRITYNSFFFPFFLNAVEETISNYDTLENSQLSVISTYELSLRLKLLNIKVYSFPHESKEIREKNIGPIEFESILEEKPIQSYLDTIYHK